MSATLLDEAIARSEICRVGRSLFDRGYVHATAGNISVRLADGFLITPTDACLGSLDPDRLASRRDGGARGTRGDRAALAAGAAEFPHSSFSRRHSRRYKVESAGLSIRA